MLMSEADSDNSADDDDDDDDDDGGVDSSTGNCLASASQLIHLPDTQLRFHKCRDINADRPAKVACSVVFMLLLSRYITIVIHIFDKMYLCVLQSTFCVLCAAFMA